MFKLRPLVVLASSFLCIAAARADITDLEDAINKASAEDMLIERMTKSYLLIGLDINPEKASDQLRTAATQFESYLVDLEKFSTTGGELKQEVHYMREQWDHFKPQVTGQFDKQTAETLLKDSEYFLVQCEKVATILEEMDTKAEAHFIHLSGKQRMLSQRIAMLYFAHALGIEEKWDEQALETTVAEFDSAMAELNNFQGNSTAINQELKKVQAQWEFKKRSFQHMDEHEFAPLVVQVTSESIMKKMDNVATMLTDM